MRALRWLVLVPSCLALLYLFFIGTVAAHYLAEQHLCPAEAFDRGICNHRGMSFALKSLLHVSMATAVLTVGMAAIWIAPAGKRRTFWATLSVLVVAAAAFGYAGNEWTLFVAALVGAGIGALVVQKMDAKA